MEINEKFPGVYVIDGRLGTKNINAGKSIYGEKLVKLESAEYRLWNPTRSKLAAAIVNGLKETHMKKDSKILYIGAASGTTASHVSDIASGGVVFCVEFAPRVFIKLLEVCRGRKNMIPVFENAEQPQRYLSLVESCDLIYQDVAQPRQAEILIENSKYYLKNDGVVMLAVKARSIDVQREPEEIFKEEIKKLESAGFDITDSVRLEPYEDDHMLVVGLK